VKKKFLGLIVGLFALPLFAGDAAALTQTYDQGFTTWTVVGVTCSTGTAIQLNSTDQLPGFLIGGYRVQNQDPADAVWLGANSSVSTDTASGFLGEKLVADGNTPLTLGKGREDNRPLVPLWCKAADAAGAAGARLSLAIFGYGGK